MATVNEKMTALADEIRELSGTTSQLSIDAMTDKVDEANAEIVDQTELITQITTLLESKSAGGTIPEGYIKPIGTLEVIENGTYDVREYESVDVNVASGGGGGTPSADGLPDGYVRCDFIQFSGKQLIDTGIIGNQDTQINTAFTWETSTQNHVFGCASTDNTASITSYTNGSWRFGNKSQSKTISSKNPKLPYSALVNKSTISLNSSVTSISGVNDFETIDTLLVGGARGSSGSLPSSGIVGKIFYFILWQNEEQVLKLIPVVNTEGVYRFWDLISQSFFDSITSTPLEGGNI